MLYVLILYALCLLRCVSRYFNPLFLLFFLYFYILFYMHLPVLAAAPDNPTLYVPIFLIDISTLIIYVLLLFSFHMKFSLLITIHIFS